MLNKRGSPSTFAYAELVGRIFAHQKRGVLPFAMVNLTVSNGRRKPYVARSVTLSSTTRSDSTDSR